MSSSMPPAGPKTSKNPTANPFSVVWGTAHTGRLLALVIVVFGFTLVTLVVVQLIGGTAHFRSLIGNAGVWAPLVYVLLKASTYVVAPLSGTTVKLASGALFGPWDGMLLSLAGDTLGGSLNYWIARVFGRAGIKKFAGKKALAHVDQATARVGGWRLLLGARLLLSSFYDFISYAAGLAKISFPQYLGVTILGGVPISILFAIIGNATVESSAITNIMIATCSITFVGASLAYLYNRRVQQTNAEKPILEGEPNE